MAETLQFNDLDRHLISLFFPQSKYIIYHEKYNILEKLFQHQKTKLLYYGDTSKPEFSWHLA